MLTKVGDTTVVVSGVKNDKVQKLAHLEVSPDSQAVVKIGLTTARQISRSKVNNADST